MNRYHSLQGGRIEVKNSKIHASRHLLHHFKVIVCTKHMPLMPRCINAIISTIHNDNNCDYDYGISYTDRYRYIPGFLRKFNSK